MKLLSLLASLSIVLALVGLKAADVAPLTERSTGEYRVARLELSQGLRLEDDDERSPQVLHLALNMLAKSNFPTVISRSTETQ